MNYNQVGNTGVLVPPIVFGTSALGNLYEALSDDVKMDIVRQAVLNVPAPVVFDSAGKYGAGLALETLGRCLHRLGVQPKDVIISNKLGWKRVPLTTPEPTFEKGVWMDLEYDAVQDISYEGIMTCFEQGNMLLGNGYYPQLVSVHDPDEFLATAKDEEERASLLQDVLEAYRALHDLKLKGEVKAVGIGSKDWKVIREIAALVELDWVMFANSMTIYRHPQELYDFMSELQTKGISIINSAVFHAGFLIGGKYFDYVEAKINDPQFSAVFEWREKFHAVCAKFQIKPATACVAYGMMAPGVVSVSLNTSNPKRIKDNVEMAVADLPPEFWNELEINKLI